MRIATWNVNSVRLRLDQILAWLELSQPDLLCLQETKVDDPLFPLKAFETNGWWASFHGQKSYNGVALVSRKPLNDVRCGFAGELPKDPEALALGEQKRVISALLDGIRVLNLYVPNGSSLKSNKYLYKLNWLGCLNRYLKAQAERGEPLCMLGDFNIASEARDIHDPRQLGKRIMASDAERNILNQAILDNGLQDVFRVFESGAGHWSWWDYRASAWDWDCGWRIDHIYLCEELLGLARSCVIHKKVRGNDKPSDHVPVSVDLDWWSN
ncbi:exodeoxyribonuclease III [Synechococcus sp. M16CYN]|uniref:exodeoxyribonuclease III n=1 Tax=Synechococcus sp. M16CYN TaxID=3103139 RepID=UPI003243388D